MVRKNDRKRASCRCWLHTQDLRKRSLWVMEPRLVGAPSSNCERWLEERFQPKSYATVSGAREGGISSILDVRVRKAGEFGK